MKTRTNNTIRTLAVCVAALGLALWLGAGMRRSWAESPGKVSQFDHDHDHGDGHDHAHGDEHGHDHGEDHGHPHDEKHDRDGDHEHAHGRAVHATPAQVERFGIRTTPATSGSLRRDLRVPAEIKIDADRVVHVVPRAAGIAREVKRSVGDAVKAGDVLAWIESEELAEAKLAFYASEAEVGCCEIKLPRAKGIFENVARLTALLEKGASPEELAKLDGLEMGEYRGQLLTAYAEFLAARETHSREESLRAKQIGKGADLLAAETALKKAEAKFLAAMDTARYETVIAYGEAAQERQVAEFDAVAAEKRLRLKGAENEVVVKLRDLVPKTAGLKPCLCGDPNCQEGKLPSVRKMLGQDERFAWYALRAPSDGVITARHIVLGEVIDAASEVFVIADLSSVWVDLIVTHEAIVAVREGQSLAIRLPDGSETVTKIDFVSPVVSPETRTAMARASLGNPNGQFRPGVFADALIDVSSGPETVLVPRNSVQLVDDKPCVFVKEGDAFMLREVKTGESDREHTEILEGLEPGEPVASENAFHLKAELTKTVGGCVGHGHAH